MKSKKISGLVLLGVFTTGVTSSSAVDVASSIGGIIDKGGEINTTKQIISDVDGNDEINSRNNICSSLDEAKEVKESDLQKDMSPKKALNEGDTSEVEETVPTVVFGKERIGKGPGPKQDTPSSEGMWVSGFCGAALASVFYSTKESLNCGRNSELDSGESQEREETKKGQKVNPQDNNSTKQEADEIWPGWRPLAISTSAIFVIVVIILVVYIVNLRCKNKKLEENLLSAKFMLGNEKSEGKKSETHKDYETTFI